MLAIDLSNTNLKNYRFLDSWLAAGMQLATNNAGCKLNKREEAE